MTKATTKSMLYSYTVKFVNDYLTQPTVIESDRIVHALNFLSCTVKDAPAAVYHDQLTAISNLRDLFRGWNLQQPAPLPDLATPLLFQENRLSILIIPRRSQRRLPRAHLQGWPHLQ